MRVLGFDPGVKNFAYSVYDTESETVVESGWVRAHDNGECDWYFLNSVLAILDSVQPDLVGIERFAFRDRASVESEPINSMIGKLHLLARMRGRECVLIMPAHWKVRYKTKELRNGAKDLFPDTKFEAIHQADAAGIAKYVYESRRDKAAREFEKAERAAERVRKRNARSKSPSRQQRGTAPQTPA